MNLIEDAWIPARRKSGVVERIAPWQITDRFSEDPFVDLAAPRPDFNGALAEFLIGLLQTTVPPSNRREHRAWLRMPPNPHALRQGLKTIKDYFQLDGNGYRFMQEPALAQEKKASRHPITYLLIGAPTDNTIKHNRDHFVKSPGKQGVYVEYVVFCLPCSAAALYTMQSFAPQGGGGGGGKFTSLRGGGPLSTILLGDTLWETAWLNVLDRRHFEREFDDPACSFPWLAPERFIKAKKGRAVTSEEMSAIHVYWGMPRRILLHVMLSGPDTTCYLCGDVCRQHVGSFLDTTMGISYYLGEGNKKKLSWINPLHPLSPYEKSNNYPSAVHPPSGGITYRHWLGLVYSDGDTKREPATVISQGLRGGKAKRLWAYGYEMSSMTARCWHESVMPVLGVLAELEETYRFYVSTIVRAAQHASGALVLALVRAAHGRPKVDGSGGIKWEVPERLRSFEKGGIEECDSVAARSEKARIEQARLNFWQSTEPQFYLTLSRLRSVLEPERKDEAAMYVTRWVHELEKAVIRIYDDMAEAGGIEFVNPKSVTLARQSMRTEFRKLSQRFGL